MRTSKPMILNVERDSVCAGDDNDAPHTKQFSFESNASLTEALSTIVNAGYMACISGGKATWIVEAAGKAVAVVAQQWQSPKFLIDPTTLVGECIIPESPNALFFRYWCQVDPDVVFERLRLGQPLPDMYGRDV